MTNKQVQEIVETIKTWNVNINDETTQKVAEQIQPTVESLVPLIQAYLALQAFEMIVYGVTVTMSVYLIGRVVKSIVNK